MRGLFCFSALLLGAALFAQSAELAGQPYHLRFFHTHTGERLDVVYRMGEQYIPEALDQLDHFLRDHRTGYIHHYDPRLFDLLNDLTASVGRAGAELNVICTALLGATSSFALTPPVSLSTACTWKPRLSTSGFLA